VALTARKFKKSEARGSLLENRAGVSGHYAHGDAPIGAMTARGKAMAGIYDRIEEAPLIAGLPHTQERIAVGEATRTFATRMSFKLLLLMFLAAYLGLAVLGWGGFHAFFASPARVALAVVMSAVGVAAILAGGNVSMGVREDRSNRWVLVAFAAIAALSAFVPAYTERLEFWTIDGDVLPWIGVVLFAVGAALRLWPVYVLGHRFSGLVAIQPGHRLVTGGIYSVIRHPNYLGLLVHSLGWALVFRSGAGLLLTALLVPPLLARISSEERLLEQEFGAEYDEFRARTSRLIPWVY
jgi:protein-S-isoprenylcysteine O-methyltransferase Ste14